MSDFQISHRDAARHGIVVGVTLPASPDAVTPAVLRRLHPDEQALAARFRGFRLVSFVGGRLAARSALQALGRRPVGVGVTPEGAPLAPRGVSLSISHKRHLAVALVAHSSLGSIGVDLEEIGRDRMTIAPRILTADEQAEVAALPPDRQWIDTAIRFSIKEAIYKALAPTLKRYIRFDEAEVRPDPSGHAAVTLKLDGPLVPRSIEARYTWLDEAVLSTVRASFS